MPEETIGIFQRAIGLAFRIERFGIYGHHVAMPTSKHNLTRIRLVRRFSIVFLSFCAVFCTSAFADDNTNKHIAESALRETRDILSRELFGHYDVTDVAVLKFEDLRDRMPLKRDYGLVKVTLEFSAKRNATKHPTLNSKMFDPDNAMCQGWLYLHCGIPTGYVFEGKLELLLAVDRDGSWKAVSPHWRSRREYPLHGYLLLEGREKEGYVLFPKQRDAEGALNRTRGDAARRLA